jgi:DNA-binding CsgD family transcriptional regulator
MVRKPTYKELAQRVRGLEKEAVRRIAAEEKLKQRYNTLKAKNRELREINASLRTMLKAGNVDKSGLGNKVMANIKELVAPYIDKLRRSRLDAKQAAYLRILQSNLHNIVSPFVHRLSSQYLGLTPTEIQVAQLIKEGKTTREIGELLNSSRRTIESHRQSIRGKLGLKGTKANLGSHLSSM